jgi:glycosyltransferase involved in cell wall biosynthesis
MKAEMMKNKRMNMTFTGYLKGERLAEVYAGSTLFVFPSSTETFGNVVLESLACGTPAVAARAGGVKELIKDRVTGILCHPGDSSEFVMAISDLIENENLRSKMSREARKYALQQSWDSIFSNLMTEYQSTIYQNQEQIYA